MMTCDTKETQDDTPLFNTRKCNI